MKIIKLIGEIELLSGLHIGGGDDTMKIGGIDNQVIKDINTDEPYIPGSSLKGKMRSLLEWDLGLVGLSDDGKPFNSKNLNNPVFNDNAFKKAETEQFLELFGDPNPDSPLGITRVSFGDCKLSDDSKTMELFEAKYENVIDRRLGTANNLRQTERVPAGVKFEYDIRIKVLGDDADKEEAHKEFIKRGMELVENDYLGGSGSRGYGRVSFSNKDTWAE